MVDPSATLSQLVAESGWLRRLARALVKDEAAADDLVHDTYVVAATQLPTDGRPLRPWLARVLWNRVRMRSRSGLRRRAREHAFSELATPPARPDDIVDHIKLQRLLAGLVLELAPAQRDVLLLHYFEGLTSSQIGARLGIPPGTVRWQLKQALDELRARLGERSPNRAWVPALAGFGRGVKTSLVPKLLAIAFVASAIFAVVLRSEVRAAATDGPRPPVAHENTRAAAQAEPERDPSSPTATRAAASLRGIEQVFGAEQRRVEGKVIDQVDRPVEGAEVEIHCALRDDAPAAKQSTSSTGGFAFAIDPECRPYVTATKGALRGTTAWFSRTGMTIRLRRAPRIIVRVLDAQTSAPIAGAAVSTTWEFVDTLSVTTRADGVARLDMELPGRIAIEAPQYVRAHRQVDDPEHPGRTITFGERADSTTELQLDVRLNRGVVVGGTVLDPDGAPVPGASVELEGPTGGDIAWADAKADAAGRFEARVPAAGRYALTADGGGLTTTGPVLLDVPADGRTNVIARLVRRGEVHGQVVDLGGHPVAAALVSAHDGRFRPVISDPSGRFTIGNVDGAIDLIAHRGSNASAFQHVQVGLGERVEVTMQVGPTGISGTAVDRVGKPVAGASVWLNYCCEQNPSLVSGTGVTTDANGAFSFDVPRGDFVLSVKRDDDDDYLADDDVRVTGGSHDVRVVVP